MNEEIEYAEMLEIPVSTVNIVRKNQRKKKAKNTENVPVYPLVENEEFSPAPLKDSVIAQVNDRLNDAQTDAENEQPAVEMPTEASGEGHLDFDPIPERIDTVRVYSADETGESWRLLHVSDYPLQTENDGGMYEINRKKNLSKGLRVALNAEFIAACALCGAIFLTNVFMPNSAINTFFRSIGSTSAVAQTDTRTYSDFTLSPVVSELSDAELSLSPAGILSFTDECQVYPAADGKVSTVTQNEDGSYNVRISYSDSFTGVINGLDQIYYAVGDSVKANVPLGFSNGEGEVQVTMYSDGVLLNCFELTEENCLAWVETVQ